MHSLFLSLTAALALASPQNGPAGPPAYSAVVNMSAVSDGQAAWVLQRTFIRHDGRDVSSLTEQVLPAVSRALALDIIEDDQLTGVTYLTNNTGCNVECYHGNTCSGGVSCANTFPDPVAIGPDQVLLGPCSCGTGSCQLYGVNVTQPSVQSDDEHDVIDIRTCYHGTTPIYLTALSIKGANPSAFDSVATPRSIQNVLRQGQPLQGRHPLLSDLPDGDAVVLVFDSFQPYPFPEYVFTVPDDCSC